MKEKYERTVTALDSFVYGIVMLLANAAGLGAVLLFLKMLLTMGAREVIVGNWLYTVVLFAVLLAFAAEVLVTFLYFRYKAGDHYDSSMTAAGVRRNYCFLVLPAEIVRFVLGVLPLKPGSTFGYRFCDGIFTFIPSYVHDQFYMTPNGRLESIREAGYTFTDNITFFLTYLVYFAVTCIVVYLVYRLVWEHRGRTLAHEDEFKLRMDPEQMK